VYEGTTDDLSTAQGKVALVKNIQDYYQGTAIERSNDFKGLSDIDAVNETDKAISLVNTYIGVGV
jgi:hypothetical protein